MNPRIIIKTLGVLAILMGLAMGVCWLYSRVIIDLGENTELNQSAYRALGISTGTTIGIGFLMFLVGIRCKHELLRREAMIIVGLSWISVSLLGAMPYWLCEPGLGVFDSIF